MARGQVPERGGWASAALVLFLCVFATLSCSRGRPPGDLQVAIVPPADGRPAAIRLTGLSTPESRALAEQSSDDAEMWHRVMTVIVAGGEPVPAAGSYHVQEGDLEFRPRFPLDPGREYVVRVDPSAFPEPRQAPPVEQTLRMPSLPPTAPAVVTGLSPGASEWPENLLRFYIHFSAPMSRSTALDFVHLVDDAGAEVEAAFLPLDVDLWNPDRTRFTVFFDPGRVKHGIRPNVELGRALIAGRKYAIAVDARWPDASGRALASPYRHEFTAGRAEERAINPDGWAVSPPVSGSRDPLVVTFPWALDHALLQRAIGVSAGGGALDGVTTVADDDRSWRFVPASAWQHGPHELVVLTLLEDPAGNRVGRPFEIEMFRSPAREIQERVAVPFVVKP